MSHRFPIITPATITWRDGQPYSEQFNDFYVSQENGLAEKMHVFIEGNALAQRWRQLSANHFMVAETGFGTGLNFLLTWQQWREHAPQSATLFYYSCEQHPLTVQDLQKALLLWPSLAPLAEQLGANYPPLTPGMHSLTFDQGRVRLCLMWGDAVATFRELLCCGDIALEPKLRNTSVDAWYLDGLAPSTNTAMWSDDFFKVMRLLSTDATTTAARQCTLLSAANFERGPVSDFPKKHRFLSTPWYVCPFQPVPALSQRKAIVIGAGLAGCYVANALAKRGWQVVIMDAASSVACGASGNSAAVLYPKFTVFQSPLNQLMLSAFLYASRVYPGLLQQGVEGQLSGLFQCAASEREAATHRELASWLLNYPDLASIVDVDRARFLTKLPLREGGLWVPDAGWINMRSLCEHLIQHPHIVFQGGQAIKELHRESNGWHVREESAPVVILATGDSTAALPFTSWLPIKRMRGQTTTFHCEPAQAMPQIPICGKGHMLAIDERTLVYGATYHQQDNGVAWAADPADSLLNHQQLLEMPIDWNFTGKVADHWGGVRAAAPDYCPIVGPVVKQNSFHSVYRKLAEDRRYFVGQTAEHHPGLYVCTGFGSRGLTTIPLAAEWLAGTIHHEPSVLPLSLIKSISPSRFLFKKIQ